MIFENCPSDHETWSIQCHAGILDTHLAFTYSVGPSSVAWSELGPAPPFPLARVLEVEWLVTGPQCHVWSRPNYREEVPTEKKKFTQSHVRPTKIGHNIFFAEWMMWLDVEMENCSSSWHFNSNPPPKYSHAHKNILSCAFGPAIKLNLHGCLSPLNKFDCPQVSSLRQLVLQFFVYDSRPRTCWSRCVPKWIWRM